MPMANLRCAGVKNPTVLQVKGRIGVNTNAPAELLDVRGNIKLNSDGGLFAPGGVENLRMVRGNVDPNGNPTAGLGFTVQQVPVVLRCYFDQPFSSMPSASVTPDFPDPDFSTPMAAAGITQSSTASAPANYAC